MSATRALLSRALRGVPTPPSPNARIYLALSGGVDSSVSGLLLKERGWDVHAVVMRCWDDDSTEDGTSLCHTAELGAATGATRVLDLPPPTVIDLVTDYWTSVFDPYLVGLRAGLTPNPDLMCNRAVKFGAFPERLRALEGGEEIPQFATGHYARLGFRKGKEKGGRCVLLAGVDQEKDQSYFLASVREEMLRNAVFPVGGLLKAEVREIAAYAGLPAAGRRSSRGICFVGKRKMGEFLKRYLEGENGRFVDAESGDVVGGLGKGAYAYTRGERARIGGVDKAYYVAEKQGEEVYVVKGWRNELLFVGEVLCERVDWVGESGEGRIEGKLCSSGKRVRCWVEREGEGVRIRFEERQRAVVEGQAIVLYQGEQCLGAAWPKLTAMRTFQVR